MNDKATDFGNEDEINAYSDAEADELIGRMLGRHPSEIMLARTGHLSNLPRTFTVFTLYNGKNYSVTVFDGFVKRGFEGLAAKERLYHEEGVGTENEMHEWYIATECLQEIGYEIVDFKSHPRDMPNLRLMEQRFEYVGV
jgi:hypothetical protein